MIAKRIFSTLIIAAALAGLSSIALARNGQETKAPRGGWRAMAMNALANRDLRAARVAPTDSTSDDAVSQGNDEAVEAQAVEAQAASGKNRIVGTWVMHVPESPGSAAFNALQTFHDGGTFTETSDLLGQLLEGPAHGVYEGKKNDYTLTFELFVFDGGQPAGRVRVRVSIKLIDDNNLTADAAVDFIEPDGNVIADIGSTPFTGTRVKVMPR
jgi:hypothetical protein